MKFCAKGKQGLVLDIGHQLSYSSTGSRQHIALTPFSANFRTLVQLELLQSSNNKLLFQVTTSRISARSSSRPLADLAEQESRVQTAPSCFDFQPFHPSKISWCQHWQLVEDAEAQT